MTKKNSDNVKNPSHYQLIDGFESIDIIACSMTVEQFKGFCLGNIIKYRLRAGNKDELEQDIAKANEYKSIFENKKHLCRGDVMTKLTQQEIDKERERFINYCSLGLPCDLHYEYSDKLQQFRSPFIDAKYRGWLARAEMDKGE